MNDYYYVLTRGFFPFVIVGLLLGGCGLYFVFDGQLVSASLPGLGHWKVTKADKAADHDDLAAVHFVELVHMSRRRPFQGLKVGQLLMMVADARRLRRQRRRSRRRPA